MANTHLQKSGVSHIKAQCISDYFTLLNAVSNNVCSGRHLAGQSYGECLLLAVHRNSVAEQYTAARRDLQRKITSAECKRSNDK